MIPSIRINNDVTILFDVFRNDSPEDFSGAFDIQLKLKGELFCDEIEPVFSIEGNRLTVLVRGEFQKVCDVYTLVLSYKKYNMDRVPIKQPYIVDVQAFKLVSRSHEATREDGDCCITVSTVHLNGVISLNQDGADGADAFEVWQRQPGNEGKTIEDYFIFLQTPAYEAGLTAVDAKNISVQKAQEAEQSASEAFLSKQSAEQAEANSKTAETGSINASNTSIEAADLSIAAKNASEVARDISIEQAGIATTKAGEASTSAQNAATSEQNAADSELAAKASEDAAKLSETNAGNSALAASGSATAAQTAQELTEAARDAALLSKTAAEAAENNAEAAQAAAELAKTGAEAARDTALNTVNDVRETGEKNSVAISSLENVINSANLNQETTATATGVDTIPLPKTAANGGMQVQLFGQSAQNLVNGKNIAPGASVTFATILNNKYYVSNQPALITGDGNNYTSTNSGATTINIVAINLTATFGPGTEITDVPTLNKLFANYFEGSKNVLGTGRIRSVGKNLFENKWELNKYDDSTGEKTVLAGWIRSVNKIIIQPSTAYWFKISLLSSSINARRVYFYDRQLKFISSVALATDSSGFIAPTNAYYMAVSVRFNPPESRNLNVSLIVEKSSVEVIYEPYRSSSLYLTTSELRSNGLIKDEIRKGTNGYELVKRVGVGTLAEKIINGGFTTDANWIKGSTWTISGGTASVNSPEAISYLSQTVDSLVSGRWYKCSINILSTNGVAMYLRVGGNALSPIINTTGLKEFYVLSDGATARVRANAGVIATIDDVSFKEVTAAEAIAATSTFTELGSNVHYTLATPTITPIAHAGLLNSNSNGTAYFEPIIADAGVYSTNLAVQLTDYPISSLERIIKRVNGVDVELSTSTAVIAGNSLSFTHPSLAAGDLVMFTYNYANESIGRSMTLTHYDNRYVIADTANGKVYRWSVVSTNGVPSLTLIEV